MERKSQPFSVRLPSRLDARISAIARRTRRSKGAVLESLADEADRCRRYPGLGFRGQDWARRPWVIGTGLDVWEIVRALQDFDGDVERMATQTDLSAQQVMLAASYHAEFAEEVDEAIAADRRSVEELRHEYPFVQQLNVPG
jgi:uncharacterized protein (DUF433 family)